MAKTQVTFSCGHTGTVELLGKYADRERKIKWFESEGLCPECYKASKRTEQESTPLTLVIDCDPYDQSIILHFDGNTMPAKDAIKAAGYKWDELNVGTFGILNLHITRAWQKSIKLDNLDAEIKSLSELNPQIRNNISTFDKIAFANIKSDQDAKQAKINAIPKPAMPEKLIGKKWNKSVYGKSGNYTVYLDGQKVNLTDADAEEFKSYVAANETYQKTIAEIE